MEETEQGWRKKTQVIHFCHRVAAPTRRDRDRDDGRPRSGNRRLLVSQPNLNPPAADAAARALLH